MLTDARDRPLAYADALSVVPGPSGGGVGLSGAMFAPGVLERFARRVSIVRVYSAHRLRLVLRGLRISFHAGEQPAPEGGWHVQAAVGTFRTLEGPRGGGAVPRRVEGRS